MDPSALYDPNTHATEALRLLADRRRALAGAWGAYAPTGDDPFAEEVRSGKFPGALWRGPHDEAVAIARWEECPPAGRKVEIHLAAPYATPAALAAFLTELSRPPAPPVVVLSAPTFARPPEALAPLLEPVGFRHFVRRDMIFPLDRPLPEPGPVVPGLRSIRREDEEALAGLGAEAYADYPLDAAYFSPGLSITEDSRRGFAALFDGRLGRWWESASFAVERDGRLVAATMVNEFQGPLISEVLVAPTARRQGLARACLRASLARLRAESAPVPRLVVTEANRRALALYRSFGFEIHPLPEDNTWIHLRRIGQPQLEPLLPTVSVPPPSGDAAR